MEYTTIELKVPRSAVSALGMSDHEMASDFSRRVAVSLHADGLLSLGKAAEMAGVPYADFMELLRAKKMPLNYSVEDLEEDIRSLREVTVRRTIADPRGTTGKPVIEGAPITVAVILERLGAGESPAEVARSCQGLTEEDVKAALNYAARVLRQDSTLHDPSGLYDDWDDCRVDEAYEQRRVAPDAENESKPGPQNPK
ncbi:MAG: UPF0175 family protein [Ignavibacteriales bacterium]